MKGLETSYIKCNCFDLLFLKLVTEHNTYPFIDP